MGTGLLEQPPLLWGAAWPLVSDCQLSPARPHLEAKISLQTGSSSVLMAQDLPSAFLRLVFVVACMLALPTAFLLQVL